MIAPQPPTPPADLQDQAVPLTAKASLEVPVEDIPLPPAGLAEALDNADGAGEASADAEVATLDFVGDELPFAEFPLRFPFRWQGMRIDTVTVRQLTTAQVGQIVGRMSRSGDARADLMDIYGAMTGLPAKVLRAMPSTDTGPIIDKAYDFLPPLLRPASG